MDTKPKNDTAKIIDEKRTEMLEEAKEYGLNSRQVLKRSRELDDLIYEYMKRNK